MPEPQRFCKWCNRALLYQRRHAKFCNQSCRNKHWVLQHRKTVEKAAPTLSEALMQPEQVVNDLPVQESVERRQETVISHENVPSNGGVG